MAVLLTRGVSAGQDPGTSGGVSNIIQVGSRACSCATYTHLPTAYDWVGQLHLSWSLERPRLHRGALCVCVCVRILSQCVQLEWFESDVEARTQISFWALFAAPFVLATDPRKPSKALDMLGASCV